MSQPGRAVAVVKGGLKPKRSQPQSSRARKRASQERPHPSRSFRDSTLYTVLAGLGRSAKGSRTGRWKSTS